MRVFAPVSIMVVVLFLGCTQENTPAPEVEYDSVLRVEVGSADTRDGVHTNEGDIYIAASCDVPVPTHGGPGSVLSYNDGLQVEMKWSNVESKKNSSEESIVFTDLSWRINNPLSYDDHTYTFGWSGKKDPNETVFSREYDGLVSPSQPDSGPARYIFIRACWSPTRAPLPEISLVKNQDQ